MKLDQIPDILYVFVTVLLVAAVYVARPSTDTLSVLQLVVGALLGLARANHSALTAKPPAPEE